jgi:hypothetical protein
MSQHLPEPEPDLNTKYLVLARGHETRRRTTWNNHTNNMLKKKAPEKSTAG